MKRSAGRSLSACSVLVLAALLGGCGTATTIARTYVATSDADAALLTLQVRGSAVSGRVEIAEGSSGPSNTATIASALTGTLRGRMLELESARKPRVTLRGKLQGTALSTIFTGGTNTSSVSLHFAASSRATFDRNVAELAQRVARAKRARNGQQAIATRLDVQLRSEMSDAGNAARALRRDAAALVATYAQNKHDVASATSVATSITALLKTTPTLPQSQVCDEVSTLRARLVAVANDDEFLAGFISGLVMSEGTVAKDATSTSNTSSALDTVLSNGPMWLGLGVPSATSVIAVRAAAATAISEASRTTSQVASAAQAALTALYGTANRVIKTSGCGGELASPSPFSLPRHA